MFFSGLIGSLASGSMTAVWLVLMVVLLIIEGAVPGLVSIWFALGAFAAIDLADLIAAEGERKLAVVQRDVFCQRHRQVKAER